MEDRRVKLGCVMPGEAPAISGDALRRLSTAATYLYQDAARFWYSTQPTVTKLAENRAEQLLRNPGTVTLDAGRVGRDAGKIAEEVIQHLAGIMGASVEVTLEIHASVPDGTPDNVARTVNENCNVLKFKVFGFEDE